MIAEKPGRPPTYRVVMFRFQCFVFLIVSSLAHAADDASYNMPPAVTGTMEADAVMAKMETAVKSEVLEAFKKQHPANFWLFGEDRQFAVRRNVIPAHWFENGAKQFQQFSGVARPGEFYVFQVCLVPGPPDKNPAVDYKVVMESPNGIKAHALSGQSRGAAGESERTVWLMDREDGHVPEVVPVWVGLQIPLDVKPGIYQGRVEFDATVFRNSIDSILKDGKNDAEKEVLNFSIKIEGGPLKESGVNEAWRLSRLKWLDSTIGNSDIEVTRPFMPIKVDEKMRSLEILGRCVTLGSNGIPARFTSFFSGSNTGILPVGREAFCSPPALECVIGGKNVVWKTAEFGFTHKTPTKVRWHSVSRGGKLRLEVDGVLEFDGNLRLGMNLSSASGDGAAWIEGTPVDEVRFVVPWSKDVAKYAMGLGLQGGLCPEKLDWKWDVSKHQDAVWIGDANIGAMLRFKDGRSFRRPLINAYYDFSPLRLPASWGSGGIRLEKTDAACVLTAYSGPTKVTSISKGSGGLSFDIDWYLTPFKPLDVKQHFNDRYYHASQGAAVEDTAKLKADGVNIVEVHHNRLCNPYINYPFNDDSFGHLQDFVKKAHGDGVRVNLYYTTRELTQNLPEFFALKSMAGEIILPRKEGVAWPVTNRDGPHPWLKEHVGEDIVPAWRENLKFPEYKQKLDLAVITTPDSRWNNFYLEGLDYLVKKAGIDGLYIDDTALDRKSMQRARRILDADGNTGRRVSMHSWNHFNGLAKWSNSSIAFMELYPYYDGLWHGEGFNANASPEYMLVEMSGIPYGLMSEMLDHPNPWHGMVFGMRTRWPWSDDPLNIWKLEDLFGIADSAYTGWWDAACPVKTDNPQVKASVYQKKGRTLIALASWAPAKAAVNLVIDWKALGLSPAKTTLWAPACGGFQDEKVFAADAAIPVAPGKGWLLIADEQPREISPPEISFDPTRGKPAIGGERTPFGINVPANTVKTKDLAWMPEAGAVVARLDPMKDEGQSWGVGLAVGWKDGKYVQINARTDGRWSVRRDGAEILTGSHAKGKPAVVAVCLDEKLVRIMAREDGGDEWEMISEFPRVEFSGIPATVRIGKIGTSWQGADFGDKGSVNPCRVEWVELH